MQSSKYCQTNIILYCFTQIRTHTVPIRTPYVPIHTHIFEISILPFGTRWVPLYPYGTRTRTLEVPGAGTRPKLPYRCILAHNSPTPISCQLWIILPKNVKHPAKKLHTILEKKSLLTTHDNIYH